MPGYVEANAHRLPPEAPSAYAAEGTQAHAHGEEVLLERISVEEVPEEFRPFVADYVTSCRALIVPNALTFVERQLPLFYLPSDHGTADFITISDKGMHFRDYKHGAGVLVPSEWNKQLAIYAYSAVVEFDSLFEFHPGLPVTLHAVQPRHHEWVDIPWTTTVGELETFVEEEITPAAEAILNGGETVFAPSLDACRWCPAKGFCEARAVWLRTLPHAINPIDCENLDAPEVMSLTDQQLLTIFRFKKEIKTFVDDVAIYMTRMAIAGTPVGSTKMVAGRQGNRKWADENEANTLLEKMGLTDFDDRFESKMRSPAQIEKRLKDLGVNAKLDHLTVRSAGQPVLALEDDKRPAITVGPHDLENLDEVDADE
jgi:hypothetical protein